MKINIFEEINKHNFNKKSLGFKKVLSDEFKFIKEGISLSSKSRSLHVNYNSRLWQSVILAATVLLFFFLLISKSLTLQVFSSASYEGLADQNRIRNFIVQPERGVIYDRNNEVLVRNKPAFSIEMNSNICSLQGRNLGLCMNIVEDLSEVLEIDKLRIAEELKAGKTYIVLATGLSKDQILPIEANIINYPSVAVSTSPQRDYIHNDAFAHLIGYVGLDEKSLSPSIVGKMGIEERYNDFLIGIPGSKVLEVDSSGKTFELISEKKSIPGKDLYLYVDRGLQLKAYELLEKAVSEGEAIAGSVVAQDPKTGGILAMASYPSFNPDKLSFGISSQEFEKLNSDNTYPFFNRAISAAYPPGSTFKMPVSAAALMEKIVTQDTIIVDPGYIQVGSYIFRNWKLDGHGQVNLKRALQVSNDVYFYTVGGGYNGIRGLGIKKLSAWAKSFGYGSKTDIDINGEVSGYMPDGTSRDWYLGDTFITAIGQGDVLATPLQVNNATVYFANGGYLYSPRIVKNIDDMEESQIQIKEQNLTDKKTYELIREGMKLVVNPGGTAYPLFDFSQRHPGIELAGKTGTSEYINSKGEEATHAWFTAFGPYENATIALTVFLEGGGSGSEDAAPIAKDLLDYWFSH